MRTRWISGGGVPHLLSAQWLNVGKGDLAQADGSGAETVSDDGAAGSAGSGGTQRAAAARRAARPPHAPAAHARHRRAGAPRLPAQRAKSLSAVLGLAGGPACRAQAQAACAHQEEPTCLSSARMQREQGAPMGVSSGTDQERVCTRRRGARRCAARRC